MTMVEAKWIYYSSTTLVGGYLLLFGHQMTCILCFPEIVKIKNK